MDWAQRMNEAIDYLEAHLLEEVRYADLARIACTSAYHFQRMFTYMTDMPLSEYVRRRRLTLAAAELQNGWPKVIDVALKYGYESPEAFARAFQLQHGVTPTAARSAKTTLKAYPKLSFHISIRGVAAMDYRIEELEAFAVIGQENHVLADRAFDIVPGLWEKARGDGTLERLLALRSDEAPIRGILGVCADGNHGANETFVYMTAVASPQAPEGGWVRREFPAAVWAVFTAEGGPEGLAELWGRLYTEWLPASGYTLADLPAVECYLPPHEGKHELWVPIVRNRG